MSKTAEAEVPATNHTADPQAALNAVVQLLQQAQQANQGPKEKQISTETVEGDVENIIIPKGMSKLDAAKELMAQHEEEETIIDLIQSFEGYMPDDTFVAVKAVCEKMFGWVNAKAKYTFFGKINPKEIQVQIDLENNRPKFETCFYGAWGISAWDDAKGDLGVSGDNVAYVKFDLKKKFKHRAQEFFFQVREHLKEHSIYKGKCLKFEEGPQGPRFMFIEAKKDPNIVLNHKEELVLKSYVSSKIGAKGKRAVLFAGPYGTGKTETAMGIGEEAKGLGVTFVYCKHPDKFSYLLNLMKNYQPAIIFLEDVDAIGAGETRDTKMNDLLNTLDGIETKGHSLMTIFTTNHEKRINPALRRPGRIDVIVKFDYCEPVTTAAIFRKYFAGIAGADSIDYEILAEKKTPRVQGAVIAEMAARAIDLAKTVNEGVLNDEIVETAVISMEFQIEFMREDIEETETPQQKIVDNLVDVIINQTGVKTALAEIVIDTKKIKGAVGA